jgi:alkylhydroperoxidase family enzyme
MTSSPRIAPAEPPYPPSIDARMTAIMPPGVPPLVLFRILARDERLYERFSGGGLLDKGHLTLRQREIVIHRVTARCGAEYEWGVHAKFFADKVGFDEAQLGALVHGNAESTCWSADEALLIAFADSLHETCDVDDEVWQHLRARFSEEAVLELLLLAGFYRTVSYLVNALRIPPEPYALRFPATLSA